MRYTVIVPVFNGEDTIEDCLGSLLNQKGVVHGRDYKILVVDDGSTDNTPHIVYKFPVELIRLPKNEGRIVARLTGAKSAGTSRILFVDARVTLPDDTIGKLDHFSDNAAVIGEFDPEETRYDTIFHTILYLIRRRYYGKQYFPMRDNEMLVTEKNFRRAPKGTSILLIDRELFIELTPERTGKDVNDDTLIFHKLVFQHGLNLLRARELRFRYSQRTSLRQFSGWLFRRGVRFSDFYLRPGGYYFVHFVVLAIGAAVGMGVLSATNAGLFLLMAFACILNAALSIYLAEDKRDFPRVFFALPLLTIIFGSGIARFWLGMLAAKLIGHRRRE